MLIVEAGGLEPTLTLPQSRWFHLPSWVISFAVATATLCTLALEKHPNPFLIYGHFTDRKMQNHGSYL
jgi:hypothetical protein